MVIYSVFFSLKMTTGQNNKSVYKSRVFHCNDLSEIKILEKLTYTWHFFCYLKQFKIS